jgi:hypothetical protein
MITVCTTNPKQIVEIYKKFFSIRDLKNIVINALQMNNIRSTGGSLSLCPKRTARRVGIAAKCIRIMVIHPRV